MPSSYCSRFVICVTSVSVKALRPHQSKKPITMNFVMNINELKGKLTSFNRQNNIEHGISELCANVSKEIYLTRIVRFKSIENHTNQILEYLKQCHSNKIFALHRYIIGRVDKNCKKKQIEDIVECHFSTTKKNVRTFNGNGIKIVPTPFSLNLKKKPNAENNNNSNNTNIKLR